MRNSLEGQLDVSTLNFRIIFLNKYFNFLQKNLKLIDRIKKYQKFFEKLEKKQKFKNKKSALNAFRGVPGARALFNDEGELDLTVEDIK